MNSSVDSGDLHGPGHRIAALALADRPVPLGRTRRSVALIEAAKKEGEVNWYTTEIISRPCVR